jgi:hypothetical protein
MTLVLAASSDPRAWLLSQPQLLFVVFAGAIWLVKFIARVRTSASRAAGAPPESGRPEAEGPDDHTRQVAEDEERTRRVREDILRKIAERRARAAVAPPPATLRVERVPPEPPPVVAAAPYAGRGPAEAAAATPPAQAPVPGVIGRLPSPLPAAPLAPSVQGPSIGALWLEELRGRENVRRAILVREILGPPLALR